MNKDHLVIHKERSLNAGVLTHYLVNTYYDYSQTYYFKSEQEAKTFVQIRKELADIQSKSEQGIF